MSEVPPRKRKRGWTTARLRFDDLQRPETAKRLVLGTTLALSMGIGPLSQFAVAAMAPLIVRDLEITRTQFGAMVSVLFAIAALTAALLGRQVDRFGSNRTLQFVFVASGAALVFASVASSYPWLLGALLISGFTQAFSNPATNKVVVESVPSGSRGLIMGVKQSGVQMSQLFAGTAMPSLATNIGWRGAIASAALLAAVGFAAVRAMVPRRRETETVADPGIHGGRVHSSIVWWLAAYSFLIGISLQATNTYLALFAYEALGLGVAVAGLSAGIVGAVGVVARLCWGKVSENFVEPRGPLMALTSVGFCAAILLAGSTQWSGLLWAAVAIHGASTVAANVVVMLMLIRLVPPSRLGGSSGIVMLGMYGGFAVGPFGFGWLVDHSMSYEVGWLGVAAAYLIALGLLISWRPIDRTRPRQSGAILEDGAARSKPM